MWLNKMLDEHKTDEDIENEYADDEDDKSVSDDDDEPGDWRKAFFVYFSFVFTYFWIVKSTRQR